MIEWRQIYAIWYFPELISLRFPVTIFIPEENTCARTEFKY
jgi:hypothetical protein